MTEHIPDTQAPDGELRLHAPLHLEIPAIALNDEVLISPYADVAERFDTNQPPLIDRVVNGTRFRIWTNLGIPENHTDAQAAFASVKWRLDAFVPELWVADGAQTKLDLARRIEAFLEAQRYGALAPRSPC